MPGAARSSIRSIWSASGRSPRPATCGPWTSSPTPCSGSTRTRTDSLEPSDPGPTSWVFWPMPATPPGDTLLGMSAPDGSHYRVHLADPGGRTTEIEVPTEDFETTDRGISLGQTT